MSNDLQELPFAEGKLFVVENYLEAVGVMTALKAGVAPSAVRRPLGRDESYLRTGEKGIYGKKQVVKPPNKLR